MSPENHIFERPVVHEIPPHKVVAESNSNDLDTEASNVAELHYETPHTPEDVQRLRIQANILAERGARRAIPNRRNGHQRVALTHS